MFAPRLHSFRRLSKIARSFSSKVQVSSGAQAPAQSYRLQFSKAALKEFGDLPQGEIPEALKYDRPLQSTQLENGVRVVTEKWNSPLASITVAVRSGSRYETLETSGVAKFIEQLTLRGTQSRTREQVEQDLDKFGGHFLSKTNRELQTFTLSFEPNQVDSAVSFLGDCLLNNLFNNVQVEAEKDALYRHAVDQSDQSRVIYEASHYNSYRDHIMGQPSHGVRENIANITADHIRDFHTRQFVGPNVIVTGAGNLDHNQFVQAVSKAFGGLAPHQSTPSPNSEKPYFTPSIITMRDDELANLNVGVFFEAPSWDHPDCLSLIFFKHILGDYRADKYTGAHLNSADKQYNQMHSLLGNLPDVTVQKCQYFGYQDTALFGNYIMGNEIFAQQIAFVSQMALSEYASYINPVEVFRARANVFNELLSQENSSQVSHSMALQTNYWGRRMPRSEFARRISALDAGHLTRVASRVFWDKDISVVLWGPTHLLQTIAIYNRPWKRSTLGAYAYNYYQH